MAQLQPEMPALRALRQEGNSVQHALGHRGWGTIGAHTFIAVLLATLQAEFTLSGTASQSSPDLPVIYQ
jgi:hypothetical protein